MRPLILHTLLIFVISTVLYAEPISTLSTPISNAIASVVKVKVQRSEIPEEDSEFIQSDSGGTGFVYDENHHILTNAHVISKAKRIAIIDINHKEYPATLVAKDDRSDIAVLYAPTFHAPVLPSGENTPLAIGDGVFVLGYPYSLDIGATVGFVSSLKRFLPNYPYQHFIQTDAAINPGHSGSPLFNFNGEWIGMATMTYSKSGNYTNIGFAIPSRETRRIADLLIAQQAIKRGYLGAELMISEKVSRKLGYPYSVLVTKVSPKSPAENAGLKAGDIITAIDGKDFFDNGDFHRYLNHSAPNNQVKLTWMREKKQTNATVVLGSEVQINTPTINIGSGDPAEKIGLILQENDQLEVLLSYQAAKKSGIASGDKILKINGTSITSLKEFNAQLSKSKENEISLLTLQRNKDIITLPLASKNGLQGYTTIN